MLKRKTDELFKELKGIDSTIRRIRKSGIRESTTLDKLLEKRENLETKLSVYVSTEGRLSDPLLDYCFRNFNGYSYINQLGERVESESAFDVVPLVEDFLKDIKNSIGEKILETYDNVPKQIGIISGNCFFEIEKTFRSLYVPVRNLLIFKDGEWEDGKERIEVEKDIFEYPAITFFTINKISRSIKNQGKRIRYKTNHSKNTYFGGPAPKETVIYIGNDYVDEVLKDKEITIKTEKKIKVPIPNLS